MMLVRLILILLLTAPGAAIGAFRCGTDLVDTGDWPVEVEERCGQPDYVAVYPRTRLPGIGVIETEEHWYYNRGPRKFIRRLVFRNGKLRQMETMGYGFSEGAAGDCTARTLFEGLSEYEVIARCGEPLSKRITWQVPSRYRGHHNPGYYAYPVEEWLYEFASTDFRRVVTFRNGRITDVETADKPR